MSVVDAKNDYLFAAEVCAEAHGILNHAAWGDPLWAATIVYEASLVNVEVKYAEWLRVSNESESV